MSLHLPKLRLQHRFYPHQVFGYTSSPMAIRAALFDMDGTIWDAPIDWPRLRREIGLPLDSRPILHHLKEMPPQEQDRGREILERHEAVGVANGELIPGTHELLSFLKIRPIKCALVSNNSRKSVDAVLTRHGLSFDAVMTRDDGAFKPDPAAFLAALQQLGARPDEAVVVGDTHLDLLAAHRARIEEIILVGTKGWAKALLPEEIFYHKAADLFEVQAIIVRLLDQVQSQ